MKYKPFFVPFPSRRFFWTTDFNNILKLSYQNNFEGCPNLWH